MTLVTVIGRGHSGTRAISHTLYASGVFMGNCLNRSGDLVPPRKMYDACRLLAEYVDWTGGLNWNFDRLFHTEIPDDFSDLIRSYLRSVLDERQRDPDTLVGWKIPETTLVYPWISRLFPKAKYIHWIRDPRDCVLGRHLTDDLADFGIQYPTTADDRRRRAISWKYQHEIVKATPQPDNWLEVRFEDFVLRQDETLARLEEYLGIRLAKIIVRPESVERWRVDTDLHDFDFFAPALAEYHYER